MKKCLLNSFSVLVLTLGASASALADNVVYGLIPSYTYGAKTTSLDLDDLNLSSATDVEPGFAFDDVKGVKCGVSVGDKYYAFVDMVDPDTYDETVALATMNFTTGKLVIVNNFSYSYGKPGYSASGMAYDEKNDQVYVIEVGFDDSDNYVTNLYALNVETGALTKVTSWDGQYQAIASDHNGGFYLLGNDWNGDDIFPNLYKVSPMFGVSQFVSNTSVKYSWSGNYSMVTSDDGKNVYLFADKKVYDFDTTNKTVALKGAASNVLAAVTYGMSSADGTAVAPPSETTKKKRFLVRQDTYGDSMGDTPLDVVSGREYFYYNTDGNLVGDATYKRGYSELSNTFSVVGIDKYLFDDNGRCTNKDAYQWGSYDYDDYAWKKTYNCETYVYDENGRLTSDSTSYSYNVYTYNDDGTLATKSNYSKRSKALLQTITYSNYDDKGNYWHYVSDGAYDSYKYEGDVSYDDDGNKVEEYQYTQVDDPDFPGEKMSKPKQVEAWTYENNILREYTKSIFDDNGNETPYGKTVYEPVDGNDNIIQVSDSTYSGGTWYVGDQPRRFVYGDFTDMAEMTAMEFNAEPDPDEPNTVDLSFSVPQLAMSQDCKFVIYRDCMAVDSVSFNDAYDEENGYCVYKDKGLKNGTYTYFVQPVFAANDELGELDESGAGEAGEKEWTGYYSTNPVNVDLFTTLPAVKNLALTGGRVETSGSIVNMRKTYYGELSWTNPEDAAKYGFLKNSVYFVDAGVAEVDTTDINANKAEVMLYDVDARAYVVTSYKLGKAVSDTIDVKIADIDRLATGVSSVSVYGAVKATFSGRTIEFSDNANVTVFTVDGQKVYADDNTSRVVLNQLPAAAYIICVEKDGKMNTYKYSLK